MSRLWWWIRYGSRPDRRGGVVPAGPNGWPPECTIVSTPPLRSVWWWSRWLIRYAPFVAWHRLTTCRHEHAGPMYDGHICLTCGRDICGGEGE